MNRPLKLRPELEAAREHLGQLQGELDTLPEWRQGTFYHAELLESLGAQIAYVRRLLLLLGDPSPVRAQPAAPVRAVADELLLPKQVARLAGVNTSCVYKWIDKGLLTAECQEGTWLIARSVVLSFLSAREARSA